MMEVANPIYDVVFKYLMEDVRVARTILSALLKQDVMSVEPRAHEYTGSKRHDLSMYRVDFAARVRQPDGTEQQILIELQKSWVPSETLRFRQYLGVQYEDARNIDEAGYGLPMVAVYILGHKVGDIEEPVLYVRHEAHDYDGNVVTRGLPDPFVSSLTHDSIIVQVPRLHGRINNRLDEVLSVFDQSQANEANQHTLLIDDSRYSEDDPDMQRILRRLLEAAASSDMRYEMNVEDEYFSQLEKNETMLLLKDQEIAENKKKLAEKDVQLTEQKELLAEKNVQITENKRLLAEKNVQITEQKELLAEKNAQLTEHKERLAERDAQLKVSVQLLQKAGLTADDIAANLHLDPASVRQLMAP